MDRNPQPALVWLLVLGVAVVGSNSLALSPILSDVAADLQASPVAVARANAAYGGATALSALVLGRFIDRLGPQRLLVLGLSALALAMVASAAATHWLWLAGAQGLAGLAAGVVLPATYALATALAPEGRGAETLGRVLTGWSVSLVAGVPASALIADMASWRAGYVLFAVLLSLSALLIARQPSRVAPRTDGGTMRQALCRPGVPALLGICLLFMTGFYGVYAYLGDHVRRLLDLDAREAGIIVLAYGVGFGLASAGDRFVDRIGPARLFPIVLAAMAGVYVGFIPGVSALASAAALAFLWGFGNHFGLNVLVLQLTRAAPGEQGSVLALNSATSYAGALVGAAGFGALYEGFGFPIIAGLAGALTLAAAGIAAGLGAVRAKQPAARPRLAS